MSPFIQLALDRRAECRAEFENYRAAEYERAAEACRGTMLNDRGKRAGIDSYSLFMGNTARAHAYASEELIEHWRRWPRPTYAEWERQQWPLYA